MKKLVVILAAVAAFNAYAAMAFFTGRQEMVQTVTGRMVWKCQYNYNGQLFWRLFEGVCPASVDVM